MSTSNSPLWKLKAEAGRAAKLLKQQAARRPRGAVAKIAMVMDDKLLAFTFQWDAIAVIDEGELTSAILEHMLKPAPGESIH